MFRFACLEEQCSTHFICGVNLIEIVHSSLCNEVSGLWVRPLLVWPTGYSAAEICTMLPVWLSQKSKMLCHILSDCDCDSSCIRLSWLDWPYIVWAAMTMLERRLYAQRPSALFVLVIPTISPLVFPALFNHSYPWSTSTWLTFSLIFY